MEIDNRIIDEIGGTLATSVLCDVTKGAVSQWRTSGIPKARLMYLRAVRPDVFKKLENSETSRAEAA